MDVIEDRGDTFDLVRQGMIGVSETVSGLKNYPVTIACKTGTPQRSETYYVGSTRKHYTNTMMIAYGPAEDAEIASASSSSTAAARPRRQPRGRHLRRLLRHEGRQPDAGRDRSRRDG